MMGETVRAWHVSVEDCEASAVTTRDTLASYYRLCGCTCIDIVTRYVEGVPFAFVVDDEGLFKEDYRISAIDSKGRAVFVGSFVVLGPAVDGELRSLTEEETELLRRHMKRFIVRTPKGRYNSLVLTGVEYGPVRTSLGYVEYNGDDENEDEE